MSVFYYDLHLTVSQIDLVPDLETTELKVLVKLSGSREEAYFEVISS